MCSLPSDSFLHRIQNRDNVLPDLDQHQDHSVYLHSLCDAVVLRIEGLALRKVGAER